MAAFWTSRVCAPWRRRIFQIKAGGRRPAPPVAARITLCKPVTMADNWPNKEEDGHAGH
jgi:hypothetical protein